MKKIVISIIVTKLYRTPQISKSSQSKSIISKAALKFLPLGRNCYRRHRWYQSLQRSHRTRLWAAYRSCSSHKLAFKSKSWWTTTRIWSIYPSTNSMCIGLGTQSNIWWVIIILILSNISLNLTRGSWAISLPSSKNPPAKLNMKIQN